MDIAIKTTAEMQKRKTIPETKKKYGYRMYNCTEQQLKEYTMKQYTIKKKHQPGVEFGYKTFNDIDHAIMEINSVFVPAEHGNLPLTHWKLTESNTLLIRVISFYHFDDQILYQCSVERAWALGGHLDPRVEQIFYD